MSKFNAKLEEILGKELQTSDGVKPIKEVLTGKTAVGLYFSAHWCPPCRGFTPKLAEMYNANFKSLGLEIVFVSSDRDQKSFDEYFAEMPWVALPFSDRDLKASLSKQYKVSGIPSLVILDPQGETICLEGRDAVGDDPTGVNYPWTPPTAAEKRKAVVDALGADLIAKASGKPIGLYFSAHWCPPCRGFTPKLAGFYKEGLKDKMEIIFISSDRDEQAFKEYFAEMPWLALPFDKREEKEALSKAMGVQGIPSFCVISGDGSVITTDGRSKVAADPKGENLPAGWLPQPFNSVNDSTDGLNDEDCLVALGEDAKLNELVKTYAAETHEAAGKDVDAMPMRFFHGPAGNVTDQIRKLTKTPDGDKLIFLDISDGGSYYVCDTTDELSSLEDVKAFVSKVKSGDVEKRSFSS